ncbi:MAG: AAA family ATPase [Halobacteriales archaeon]|nr:AAA family ATPase [Halobacteriales archaeon]
MSGADELELTVVDGGEQGTERPVARLAEPARRALGVLSGDQVVVEGAGAVIAAAWPAEAAIDGEAVGLDRTTQRLVGVEPGETVRVRSSSVADAIAVTVEAADGAATADTHAVREALRHRPVWAGDRFEAAGGELEVVDTRPTGPVRITGGTGIHVHGPAGSEGANGPSTATEGADDNADGSPSATAPERPARPVGRSPARATYDDIGGLDEELALVREMVELPLAEPELFDRLGIDPPTGVLLYGPPGTGKTLIVEALAGAIDATVYHVSGPELTSKYKGESEKRLREVFARARETAPAVVFFDEIDAIAAKREDGADMENRVVGQLLSVLDGLDPRGDVVVIGATNRIDTLDPALRRPGRFDREIQVGVPDEAGRREILAVHAEGVPLTEDVDLDRLAARTHGFVGADLKALITEAAMAALRRARAGDGDPRTVEVTPEDVETAMAGVEPSAMREVVAEVPVTGFDDVGGLDDVKATLTEAVQWPLEHPELFEAAGTEPPSGILLYGPPGTGKTLLARALAHESGVNVIHVRGPELLDKYVGESERAVREVFERARQVAPALVFFDEIDALAGRRAGEGDVTERVVSQLLTELDGLADSASLVVLAATNRKDALDPALLRPGRFDTQIAVPEPDEAARRAILAVHTRDAPLADDVDLDRLAARLEGATGADIAAMVRDASLRAIRELLEAGPADRADLVIRGRHLDAAIAERGPD